MLDILNISITANGDIVTNVASLPIKSAHLNLIVLSKRYLEIFCVRIGIHNQDIQVMNHTCTKLLSFTYSQIRNYAFL